MIVSTALQGFGGMAGGATPRKTTKITLDPIVIEGKAPAASSRKIPWAWIAVGGGLLGLYLLARSAGKKGRRGPLGVAA